MKTMTCTTQIRTLILFVVLVIVVKTTAQEITGSAYHYIQIDSSKQKWGDWADPEWLRYFGLDAGDIDRDGNLDIVSGRYIYHNPGGDMKGKWERTVLDDNVDGILLMNVDNDIYGDLIAMALPNLYWYEAINKEGTQFTKRTIGSVPATSHVNSQGFEKAQLLNAGQSEIVIAGNGNIYALKIPKGEDVFKPWPVHLICENTSDEGIGIGDLDGDGDADIAAGRRPEGKDEPTILVWFENPGHLDTSWKEYLIGESVHPIDRVVIADFNGDNKGDIALTEERYPGLEPDAHFWWFQQKSAGEWERHLIIQQYSMNNLDLADFDNDGDMDLLTAEHKGEALSLQWWENNGEGSFVKNTIDTGKENHLGTQWVDLDLDGDLDIIGAGWDHYQYMHLWRNDKVRSFKSGSLYKDYPWSPTMSKDKGKFLRVGGKLDYKSSEEHFPQNLHREGYISLGTDVDLKGAAAAEVIVERIQSHEDTKNLRISFNEGNLIKIPEPARIPEPRTDYMFHTNIRVPVPLSDIKHGDNSFKLTVDPHQRWDWPQNLVYGIVLRVYYSSNVGNENQHKIVGLEENGTIAEELSLSLSGEDLEQFERVRYIGLYNDVNYQGDGQYRQWQQDLHRGQPTIFIGESTAPPYKVHWDTEWIPDQSKGMAISALLTDKEGKTRVLQPVTGLSLDRDHRVSLIKPSQQDPFWTTRNDVHKETLEIPIEPQSITAVNAYLKSWSPCYTAGIRINDKLIEDQNEYPCYDSFWHELPISDMGVLKEGVNVLETLKTPLHNGKMVHGMDVQWPGIMLKIKHQRNASVISFSEEEYEGRPHIKVTTSSAIYYYDKAGGGFSRILDPMGNDWISYRNKPWNEYPASAASAFRGLPNLVYSSKTQNGAGHPGHDKCISEVIGANTIVTRSINGPWSWVWTFYDSHAIMKMLSTEEGIPYWFLYEGTPGGKYDIESYSFGTNLTGPINEKPDYFKGTVAYGDYQWAYFNRSGVPYAFYLAQVENDQRTDMMSYLGSTDSGAESKDGMTVFGFGRGEEATPLLREKHSFVIGIYPQSITNKAEHKEFEEHIDKLLTHVKSTLKKIAINK